MLQLERHQIGEYAKIPVVWLTTVITCRFYTEDANVNNNYRAAGIAIELRDTGQYGFVLPPSQVWPTGRHNFIRFSKVLLFCFV